MSNPAESTGVLWSSAWRRSSGNRYTTVFISSMAFGFLGRSTNGSRVLFLVLELVVAIEAVEAFLPPTFVIVHAHVRDGLYWFGYFFLSSGFWLDRLAWVIFGLDFACLE